MSEYDDTRPLLSRVSTAASRFTAAPRAGPADPPVTKSAQRASSSKPTPEHYPILPEPKRYRGWERDHYDLDNMQTYHKEGWHGSRNVHGTVPQLQSSIATARQAQRTTKPGDFFYQKWADGIEKDEFELWLGKTVREHVKACQKAKERVDNPRPAAATATGREKQDCERDRTAIWLVRRDVENLEWELGKTDNPEPLSRLLKPFDEHWPKGWA
ncbi:hypothetical protein JCM8097_002511 [Rhodosporidiobolus ruineniae]